ncbi:hypothetical protein D3C76_864550 [compost metagenome]
MDIRLLLGDPVDLGLATEVIDRTLHAGQLEQPAPWPLDAPLQLGTALVQPDDSRTQRPPRLVDMDHRGALGGQRHATDQAAIDIHLCPQRLAGFAELLPIVFGVLLGPAGVRRVVGLQLDPALAEQIALQVEQQRAHALGAVVDGQQVARFAQGAILIVVCSARWVSLRSTHPTKGAR